SAAGPGGAEDDREVAARATRRPYVWIPASPAGVLTARAATSLSSSAPPGPAALAPRRLACRHVRCAASAFCRQSAGRLHATSARALFAWRYDDQAKAASEISTLFAKAESDRTPGRAR